MTDAEKERAAKLDLLTKEENEALLTKAERLWKELQDNNLGGYSGINRPFWILAEFKDVIEQFGRRDVGQNWSKNQLDALAEKERAAIVAWLREETGGARSEIVEYRGAGDTVGALCSGERILTLKRVADAIQRGDHLENTNG